MQKKVVFLGGILFLIVGLKAQAAEDPVDKRVLGVLPNYRTANLEDTYTPISTHRKLVIAAKDSFDYPLVGVGAVFAGLGQAGNADPSYGQGAKGFAKRLAAGYGDQMIG